MSAQQLKEVATGKSQEVSIVPAIRADFKNPAFRSQILAALPKSVDIEKFERVVLTAIQSNYMLVKADRHSLLKACMEAAADGLLPDGREGAIVPYRDNKANKILAQWQPMVWGLVKLVRNSGELRDIGVEIVRTEDEFERWIDENGPHFKHKPSLTGAGSPVGVYAYARTLDGGFYIEYMNWKEIERFKSLSKASAPDSPWQKWPDEMAKVRPIKRLCKRLPMSTDAVEALRRDEERDTLVMNQVPEIPQGAVMSPVVAITNSPSEHFDFTAMGPEPDPVTIDQSTGEVKSAQSPEVKPEQKPQAQTMTVAEFNDALNKMTTPDEVIAHGMLIESFDKRWHVELSNAVGSRLKAVQKGDAK